jgi:hypothetical protein
MKNTVLIVIVVALCVCFSVSEVYGQKGDNPMIESYAQRLLAGEQYEREQALQSLNVRQFDARQNIANVLEEASRTSRSNTRYMSPLHCAIQAVGLWLVYEAEDGLFSIIDYELERQSVPDGISVGEGFFYPAANALVSLRIEPRKVVDAIIVRAESDRQVKVLTWLLTQRTGTIESSITFIEGTIEAQGTNPNLVKSVEFLKSVEHRGDLLIDQNSDPGKTDGHTR